LSNFVEAKAYMVLLDEHNKLKEDLYAIDKKLAEKDAIIAGLELSIHGFEIAQEIAYQDLAEKDAAICGMREALRLCVEDLKVLSKGEACEHDVNICWCSTWRALEAADLALSAAPECPHKEKLDRIEHAICQIEQALYLPAPESQERKERS